MALNARFSAGSVDEIHEGLSSLRVPIVKENWALLIEEALDVTRQARMESFFRDENGYQMACNEIND